MAASSVPNAGDAPRFPSEHRIDLALHAAGQIENLTQGIIEQIEDGAAPRRPVLNLVAVRLHDLSRAIQDALGDEVVRNKEIREVVNHGQVIVVDEASDDEHKAGNGADGEPERGAGNEEATNG